MAGKRNTTGEVQATDLKEAVGLLMAEMNWDKPPKGWHSFQDLLKSTGIKEKALERFLKRQNVPKKKFRIHTEGGQIRSMNHYFISK